MNCNLIAELFYDSPMEAMRFTYPFKPVLNRKTTHLWDGQNIVLETNTSGEVKAVYIRGLSLIAQVVGEEKFYYLHNAHGDVVQRIAENGTSAPQYKYDAFGNEKEPKDTDPNPFRYCGEYFDSEVGEVYLRKRTYDPNIGRFLTEDPIRAGLNWYHYCDNNPISFIDPTGEDAVWLQYEDGAKGNGHTSLLMQDESGEWWVFYYGAQDAHGTFASDSAGIKNSLSDVPEFVRCESLEKTDINMSDMSGVEKFLEDTGYLNELSGTSYFEGDFTKSLEAAQDIYSDHEAGKGMKYNLLNNNCMQVSADLLQKGTFKNNDADYKKALSMTGSLIVPNLAFLAINQFNTYIDLYNKKSWWDKLWTKQKENPWSIYNKNMG